MSVVIIGGHECMESRYKEICKKYHCKAKVFTKMKGNLSEQIGNPDLMILFTATASHKMVNCAVAESKKKDLVVERSHNSSGNALEKILEAYA